MLGHTVDVLTLQSERYSVKCELRTETIRLRVRGTCGTRVRTLDGSSRSGTQYALGYAQIHISRTRINCSVCGRQWAAVGGDEVGRTNSRASDRRVRDPARQRRQTQNSRFWHHDM